MRLLSPIAVDYGRRRWAVINSDAACFGGSAKTIAERPIREESGATPERPRRCDQACAGLFLAWAIVVAKEGHDEKAENGAWKSEDLPRQFEQSLARDRRCVEVFFEERTSRWAGFLTCQNDLVNRKKAGWETCPTSSLRAWRPTLRCRIGSQETDGHVISA